MEQPKYPQYISYSERLKSFDKNWPKFYHIRAELLAQVGYVYTEVGDAVTCFFCGITMKDWEPGDQPWDEHRYHSPNCGFVLMAGPPDIGRQPYASGPNGVAILDNFGCVPREGGKSPITLSANGGFTLEPRFLAPMNGGIFGQPNTTSQISSGATLF